MKGTDGSLFTSKDDLKKETIEYYSNVLKNREFETNLKNHKKERDKLCAHRLDEAKEVKTPPGLRRIF